MQTYGKPTIMQKINRYFQTRRIGYIISRYFCKTYQRQLQVM